MSHEWKFGDWAWSPAMEEVCRFVVGCTFLRKNSFLLHDHVAKYLPDCDGFDWNPPKPIEPPEGYRLVTEGSIQEGDYYRANDGRWYICLSIGDSIPFGLAGGGPANAYARKIKPQYRPFANAAEYEPFAEKWISRSEMGVITPGAWRPIGYSDIGIYPDVSVMEYADAFKMLKFKDGTPFGVLVE